LGPALVTIGAALAVITAAVGGEALLFGAAETGGDIGVTTVTADASGVTADGASTAAETVGEAPISIEATEIRSLQTAVQVLNEASATQAEAVEALTQVVTSSGREFAQASLQGAPGTIALTGVQFQLGGTTAAIAVAPTGVATFGSGVANIVDGAFTISEFIPK